MPSAAANSENEPITQKKYLNQEPTRSASTSPSVRMKLMSLARPSRPYTVEYASSEVNRMVKKVIRTNVQNCSRFANLHQPFQRDRFADAARRCSRSTA